MEHFIKSVSVDDEIEIAQQNVEHDIAVNDWNQPRQLNRCGGYVLSFNIDIPVKFVQVIRGDFAHWSLTHVRKLIDIIFSECDNCSRLINCRQTLIISENIPLFCAKDQQTSIPAHERPAILIQWAIGSYATHDSKTQTISVYFWNLTSDFEKKI